MAVAFGSLSSLAFGVRTNSVVPAPTGIANGDTLIATITTVGTTTAPGVTAPAGWSQVGTLLAGTGSGGVQAAYVFKKVAASESGSYTFTHGNANIGSQAIIERYTGSNGVVNAVSSTSSNAANTTRTATSITTTVANCMLLYLGFDFNDTGTETPPTGMTERFDTSPLYAAELLLTTAGATGDKTNTCNSASGDIRAAWLIALEPAGSGSVGAASGTGAAAGVGQSTKEAPGAAAGTGAAAGVGRSISAAVGTAGATGAVASIGASVASSVGESSGASTVDAVASPISASTGSVASTSTVSGTGNSIASMVGAASGSSTVDGVSSGTLALGVQSMNNNRRRRAA